MFFHEYIMVVGSLCTISRMTRVVVYGCMSRREGFQGFRLSVQFLGFLEREFCVYGFVWACLTLLVFGGYFLGFMMFSLYWLG